jgi:phage shock protein C
MDRTIVVNLNGHPDGYRLEVPAYDRLQAYLDEAAAGLHDDPDAADVLGDLERSVGDKLSVLLDPADRLVTATDIEGVLEQIGAVETARQAASPSPAPPGPPPKRRLQRIRTGQKVAGVCTGLADYAQLDVDWVRTFFLLATVLTAGVFGLVYVGLAFILPVAETRAV